MEDQHPLVSIICPTYDALPLLKETFPTIIASLKCMVFKTEFIVVDNGSGDGTSEYIKNLGYPVSVHRLESNLGFSKACNIGAKIATGDYLFFINNDIKTDGDFLTPLLNLYSSRDDIFAVGPLFLRWDGVTFDDGARNPYYENGFVEAVADTENLKKEKSMVFFLGGGFLVQRVRFWELGGFDEIYSPFAWEDLDLGYRSTKRGYISLFCPSVTLFHKREATSKNIFSPSVFKATVWRNKFIFMWANFTDFSIILNHVLLLPFKLVKFLFNGRWPYVWGFFQALILMPSIIRKRHSEKIFSKLKDIHILKTKEKTGD